MGWVMDIDEDVFKKQFNVFKERVASKSGKPFVSFHEGLPHEWESYKEPLRKKALVRLNPGKWEQSTIGKGNILASLISAIEIPKEGNDDRNNLVEWTGRYGQKSKSHSALINAKDNQQLRDQIEAWAFTFYRTDIEPDVAFKSLRSLVGSHYDLVAYLFFLKKTPRLTCRSLRKLSTSPLES